MSHEPPTPKRLKTLASAVRYDQGNTLLHQFVLNNSEPNSTCSGQYINAVLRSVPGGMINSHNHFGHSPLHLAVLKQNLLMVRKLLLYKLIVVNSKCYREGNTPLHLAAKLGNLSIVKELAKKGVDGSIKNYEGSTALCLAAKSGHLAIMKVLSKAVNLNVITKAMMNIVSCKECVSRNAVKLLLNKGADVNVKDSDGQTPLHFASRWGKLEIAELLIDKGASVNLGDKHKETPLHYAVEGKGRMKCFEIVEILENLGIKLSAINCDTPQHSVEEINNCLAVVKLLVGKGADVNALNDHENTALHHSAYSAKVEISEFLVSKGADVNARNVDKGTPLHSALKCKGEIDQKSLFFAHRMLSKRANINPIFKKDAGLLHPAQSNFSDSILEIIEKMRDSNTTKNCKSPLHYVPKKTFEIVEFLVSKGADVNAVDKDNKTPLHYAPFSGCVKAVEFLVRNGADINAKDKDMKIPLHYAVKESFEISQFFLSQGADVNVVDEDNKTPLHYGTLSGNSEMVKLLVENGADANAIDKNIKTPLHYGVEECFEIVECLVSKGADVNAVDKDKKTPLHYATWSKDSKLVELSSINKADGFITNKMFEMMMRCTEGEVFKISEFLLCNGADVSARDKDNKTPLHYATLSGRLKTVELLVKNGAAVNATTKDLKTPLHYAVEESFEIVECLVGKGAYVNAADKDNKTPLHYATFSGSLKTVEFLVANGANLGPIVEDTQHCYGVYRNNVDIATFLVNHGADPNILDKSG